jgi:excisionase family DNA binding protein
MSLALSFIIFDNLTILIKPIKGLDMGITEKWMSVGEIAEHLGVAAITIYRWLEKGHIPAHRVGRQWRFNQSEVDAWVKSGDASEDSGEQVSING